MHVLRGRAERLLDAVARDRHAIRRPRRVAELADLVRHAARRAVGRRRDVDVGHGVALAVRRPVRDERDLAAIGRPGRLQIVPVACGEPARLASGSVDEPHVLAALIGEEALVGLVAHALVDAWSIVVGLSELRVLHRERDPAAIRRPREIAAVVLERGQLPRLAPVEREHEDVLWLALLPVGLLGRRAIRQERERPPIG